ncbi:MAG TPA: hypothetical protein VI322_01095, partial [Candidatus Saccharimonadia bacterium]
RDLRAAKQSGGTLTMAPLTAPLVQLYHYCVRDQVVINEASAAQLPAIQERWIWNSQQSGALSSASSAIRSLLASGNQYSSANLSGQFPSGRNATVDLSSCQLTSIDLTGCEGITTLLLNQNSFDQAAVDGVLTTVNGWGTSGGTLDLTNTANPSPTGQAAITSLLSRSWTVSTDSATGGVDADNFQRADVTGMANIGNGWFAVNNADADIVSGDLIRTDSGAYRLMLNPSAGDLPANYTVTASIPAGTIGNYFGLVGRWAGGNGVTAFLNTGPTDVAVFEAANYMQNPASLTMLNPIPASWTSGTGDHTFAMRMSGTTITVVLDGVDVAQATISINAAATGTGYGISGEGQGRAWHSIGTTVP